MSRVSNRATIRSIARICVFPCLILTVGIVPAEAQEKKPDTEADGHAMDHMAMPGMDHSDEAPMMMPMTGFFGPYSMTREASGTSWQPDSTPHEGVEAMAGDWMLMGHASLFAVFDHQGGPRGGDQSFGEGMVMGMAQRPLAGGTFGLRAMLSPDPVMGPAGYRLLFATGETANGRTPLVDRQHPHDLFMELAASYSHPLSDDTSLFVYFGLPGEPALGPPAFMHRFSGADIPEAPITHHWLDSTHITFGVLTAGYVVDRVKIEGSAFRGREPDQNRYDIETPALDSLAARLTYNPTADLSLQASWGYLTSPEQLTPNVNENRVTASATYNKPLGDDNWATTFAWGRKMNHPGNSLDGFLLESEFSLSEKHTFLGRIERVDEDELFGDAPPLGGRIFTVDKLSLGYIRDFPLSEHLKFGIGGLASAYAYPSELRSAYGNNPISYMAFIRLKVI